MAKTIWQRALCGWQEQWASEQARQELCKTSFASALSNAEVSLQRKAAAFVKSLGCQGLLARSKEAWVTYRSFEAWLVWLAAEKGAHQFARREAKLRMEEEQHEADLKGLMQNQVALNTWIQSAQQHLALCSKRRRSSAVSLGQWVSVQRCHWEEAKIFHFWSLAVQRARNMVQQEQLVRWKSRHRLLLCLSTWHSYATCNSRTHQRLELEEREAALPKRQSKDLKLRLCKYMDWLTLCDSKKAERINLHFILNSWHLEVSVSRRCRSTTQRSGESLATALLARSWAAWYDAHVQAQVATLCAQEHSQALEVKAVQDARTGEIAGRCVARQLEWLMMTILRRWWWSATTGRGLQRANDQLEQEGRLCASAAQAAQQELNQQKDALAVARHLRSRERLQLEKQLTEAQEALSSANAELVKENASAAEVESELQRVDALLTKFVQGDDEAKEALKALVSSNQGSNGATDSLTGSTSSYPEAPRDSRAQAKVKQVPLPFQPAASQSAAAAWSVRLRSVDAAGHVRTAYDNGQS
eukprot:symbB.v1.2.036251.t1/scaffold5075.1/size31222/1